MDHWFEIDIVRDERFEEILKHAVSEETPEAANTPEETPEAADRQPRGGHKWKPESMNSYIFFFCM